MDYEWLFRLLSADIPSGELMDVINPSRVSQRSRVQAAKNRKWDQAHDAARGHYANRNALALNHPMPPMWQNRSTPSPWDYQSPAAPVQQTPAPPEPQRLSPPQRPYPGQGAPIRPPIPQQVAPPPPPQRRPAPTQAASAAPQISPQDYYALLKAGMFRMG